MVHRAKARLPADLPHLAARIRRCTWCDLADARTHAVPGEGPRAARVFLLGEAPGRREDAAGRPFQGAAGRVLEDALDRARLPRNRAFITNAVKCRPPENRRPRSTELETCRPYLLAQLAAVRPRVVVALGETALRDLLGRSASLAAHRGTWSDFCGRPVLATYHPAAVLYNRRLFPVLVADLRRARRRAEAA